MTTTMIPDGVYYLHPEGGCWRAAVYHDGRKIGESNEADQSTHDAANDHLAGLAPSDDDIEVTGDVAEAIVREVMGAKTNLYAVVVTRPVEYATVCDHEIKVDRSGRGHAWTACDVDSLPANVAEEIAAEMIDGGQESCDKYIASNGQHYRW